MTRHTRLQHTLASPHRRRRAHRRAGKGIGRRPVSVIQAPRSFLERTFAKGPAERHGALPR